MNNRKANSKQKQLQMKKRKQIQMRKLRKKRRALARKLFFSRLLMFFLIFIVMLAVTVGLFFINLFIHDNVTSLDYVYQIGSDTDAEKITAYVSYNTLYINGKVYINMSQLAAIHGFITTGDLDSVRFLFVDTEESITGDVKFFLNSSFAYINGVHVRLTSPVYKKGKDIFIPMTFINTYISGIRAEYDEYNQKLTITTTETKNKIFTLNLYLDEITENIPEASLDYTTLYLTDPERLREAEANAESGEIN